MQEPKNINFYPLNNQLDHPKQAINSLLLWIDATG